MVHQCRKSHLYQSFLINIPKLSNMFSTHPMTFISSVRSLTKTLLLQLPSVKFHKPLWPHPQPSNEMSCSPPPEGLLLHGAALQLALHVGLSVVDEGVDGSQGAAGLRHAPLAVVHGCGGAPAESLASLDAASRGIFMKWQYARFLSPPEGSTALVATCKAKLPGPLDGDGSNSAWKDLRHIRAQACRKCRGNTSGI